MEEDGKHVNALSHYSFPTHFPTNPPISPVYIFIPWPEVHLTKPANYLVRLHKGRFFPLYLSLPSAPPISLLTLITVFFPHCLLLGIPKRALDAIWTADTHRFPQHAFTDIRDTVLRFTIDTVAVLCLLSAARSQTQHNRCNVKDQRIYSESQNNSAD